MGAGVHMLGERFQVVVRRFWGEIVCNGKRFV